MAYIQIEIGGKLRGLKFNMQLAKDEFLKTIDFKNYLSTANYAMFWAGLYANAYVKKEELTTLEDVSATFENVCEWVDALDQETIDRVSLVLNESAWFKALVEASKKINEALSAESEEEKKSELQPEEMKD